MSIFPVEKMVTTTKKRKRGEKKKEEEEGYYSISRSNDSSVSMNRVCSSYLSFNF